MVIFKKSRHRQHQVTQLGGIGHKHLRTDLKGNLSHGFPNYRTLRVLPRRVRSNDMKHPNGRLRRQSRCSPSSRGKLPHIITAQKQGRGQQGLFVLAETQTGAGIVKPAANHCQRKNPAKLHVAVQITLSAI